MDHPNGLNIKDQHHQHWGDGMAGAFKSNLGGA